MDWATIVPIILSIITALVIGGRRIFSDFAHVIQLLTELREKISLAQVGVDTLGIVDLDIKTHLLETDRRISDIERYLQLYSQENDHPFIIRAGGRKQR